MSFNSTAIFCLGWVPEEMAIRGRQWRAATPRGERSFTAFKRMNMGAPWCTMVEVWTPSRKSVNCRRISWSGGGFRTRSVNLDVVTSVVVWSQTWSVVIRPLMLGRRRLALKHLCRPALLMYLSPVCQPTMFRDRHVARSYHLVAWQMTMTLTSTRVHRYGALTSSRRYVCGDCVLPTTTAGLL